MDTDKDTTEISSEENNRRVRYFLRDTLTGLFYSGWCTDRVNLHSAAEYVTKAGAIRKMETIIGRRNNPTCWSYVVSSQDYPNSNTAKEVETRKTLENYGIEIVRVEIKL